MVEIPYEDLKRAVLNAEIKHADVALRMLARIDGDPEFRDAVTAVVITQDPTLLATFAYAHFSPIERFDQFGRTSKEPVLPKLEPPVDARELATLLNDRAVLVASRLLANGKLDEAVERWVERRTGPLINAVVGVDDDSFHGLRLSTRSLDAPVVRAIRARVEEAAQPAIDKALDAIDFSELTNKLVVKAHQEIRNYYERAATDYIQKRAKAWAEQQARLDIDKLLEAAETQLRND